MGSMQHWQNLNTPGEDLFGKSDNECVIPRQIELNKEHHNICQPSIRFAYKMSIKHQHTSCDGYGLYNNGIDITFESMG